MNRIYKKGFTLIELLIVIAVLGILATIVIATINPDKRIKQAKDTKLKSDIAQIANAMQAYYTAKGTAGTAYYPPTVAGLVTAGELKSEPFNNGSSYSMKITPAACSNCTDIAVYATLNETPANVWCWRSSTGVASEVAAASCTAP